MLPLRRDRGLIVVGFALFLSGAAALAYQVAWQRILAIHTGVGLYSIAAIVAVFMLGLGLGSHLGAVASKRVARTRALLLFGACELGIAAYGALSCRLLYDWLYVRQGWLFTDPLNASLVHFAVLALPTILMGTSLPLLTRAMVRRMDTAGGTIGFLYGVNVLGAAAGALATPWIFFRRYGVPAAVWGAVAANLVAGGTALVLASRRTAAERTESPGTPERAAAAASPPASWLVLYGLSGFCALALEIVWFRLMEVSIKSTAYTFGTLLALYLLGSGIGVLAGMAVAPRLAALRRAFLACQCLLLAYAGAAVALLAWMPRTVPGYAWLYDLWGGRVSYDLSRDVSLGALAGVYLALPLALFGIPTVLMGLSYPILQRAVQDDPRTSGFKVGMLQAMNIAGCVIGSLLVGLGTLGWLGTPGTLRLLMAIGLAFAALGLREPGGRRLFVPLAAALALVIAVTPSQRRLWLRLHGTAEAASLLEEDATGVVALVPERDIWKLWAGGRWHSRVPYGDIHTVLGAAPAIIHPAPLEVAIIGLGSGDTAASAGCRRDLAQHITVFELYAPEHRLLRRLSGAPGQTGEVSQLLEDPRFTYSIADGRTAIDRGGRLYDLIEADAIWSNSPYAGNLYSFEFYRMCARHLRPGGLLTTWRPTARVGATFLAALPYVVALSDGAILIGSDSPIPLDRDAWGRRLDDPAMADYLGRPRVDTVWEALQGLTPYRQEAATAAEINHDLFPRDEFETPDQ